MCMIFVLVRFGPLGLIGANVLNVGVRIVLNGVFTFSLLTKQESRVVLSTIFPDSRVIAAFIACFSGGFYLKHTYEYPYTAQTPILEVLKNPFFLSLFGFLAFLGGVILLENRELVRQIIKRKTD